MDSAFREIIDENNLLRHKLTELTKSGSYLSSVQDRDRIINTIEKRNA